MSYAHWDEAALLDVVGERGPLSLFLVTSYGSIPLFCANTGYHSEIQ